MYYTGTICLTDNTSMSFLCTTSIVMMYSLSLCVCLFRSLADTYSDGLGNLDFERSQLGSGMSQRSAGKRLINALHMHAQRTNQNQFDLQMIRSVADRLNIKVRAFRSTETQNALDKNSFE